MMMRPVNLLLLAGLLATMLVGQTAKQARTPAKGEQTFTGRVTDSMCSNGDHRSMHMGDTDADCTRACVLSHGAQYVLFDGKDVYTFTDQKVVDQFAGMKVSVIGVVDAKTGTIKASQIKAVK